MHVLLFIFYLLLILLIVKLYLNYINTNHYTLPVRIIPDITQTTDYKLDLLKMKADTQNKINLATENGYIEGFNTTESQYRTKNSNKNSNKHSNNNDTIVSYLNKNNTIKLMLFYKISCSYCSNFLPIWYQIINNLPNNVKYEEIECDKDSKRAIENKISSVPTLILLVNNEKKIYIGDRSYKDIVRFLRLNGVNLVERTFEEFNSNGYSNEPEPTIQKKNNNCPVVSFDKQINIEEDNYMFQIFNSDGQYGYSVGGNKEGKILTPFTAAYSTVDSYLSSLPYNDAKYITECANLYSKEIRNFGLCDNANLNKILSYQTNVSNGKANARFDGTDFNSNKTIINSIKSACKI